MNSNRTPFKKRTDPFATTPRENDKETEVVVEKPLVKEIKEIKKSTVKINEEANREKYTATMEKSLRRRVKVASAMTGIQVSTFIEQACLEKLEREGQ